MNLSHNTGPSSNIWRMAPRCETPHPYEPIRCGLPVEHYGSHWAIDHTDELYKWRTVVETQGESAA